MKDSNVLLLAGGAAAAYYFFIYKPAAEIAAAPGKAFGALAAMPGQVLGALAAAPGQALGMLAPGPLPPSAFQPDYPAQIESMQEEFQEHLVVQEEIRAHEAERGAAPAGYRYVRADTGVGITPTAPITPAAVVAEIPQVYVAPERIAYQAEIGIPIRADAPRRDAYIPASLGPAARAEAVAYSEQGGLEETRAYRVSTNPALARLLAARGRL